MNTNMIKLTINMTKCSGYYYEVQNDTEVLIDANKIILLQSVERAIGDTSEDKYVETSKFANSKGLKRLKMLLFNSYDENHDKIIPHFVQSTFVRIGGAIPTEIYVKETIEDILKMITNKVEDMKCYNVTLVDENENNYEIGVMAISETKAISSAEKSLLEGKHINGRFVKIREVDSI